MSSKVVYPSLARTATPAANQFAVPRGVRGVRIVLDATAITSTPSVIVTIDAFDSTSGKWINLLTSLAVATVSTNVYTLGPAITAAANVSAQTVLADQIRVVCTHGNGNSITYSVGATLVR